MNRQKPILNMATRTIRLFFAFCALALIGCSQQDLHFAIEYDQVNGLKKGAPVTYQSNPVGIVEAIDYTDQGTFLVAVALTSEHVSLATEQTEFVIRNNQSGDGFVDLIEGSAQGALIQDGSKVKGSTALDALAGTFERKLGAQLQSFTATMQQAWADLQGIPVEEQIGQLEQQIEHFLNQFESAGKTTQDTLKEQVIPALRAQIEQLRKKLESLHREDEIPPLEERLNNLENAIEA
ncbi:MlaD family protein [Oleiphilus messinensis]|nr:MlaD family protein [Oleiphilus messinensis]